MDDRTAIVCKAIKVHDHYTTALYRANTANGAKAAKSDSIRGPIHIHLTMQNVNLKLCSTHVHPPNITSKVKSLKKTLNSVSDIYIQDLRLQHFPFALPFF